MLFAWALLCLCVDLKAQLTARIVKDSLFIPWELVYGPDNHIWFTQKNGYICRLDPATSKTDTLYHETNTVIQSEGGMLGMALDPNFSTSPYVYVAYNYSSGGYKERVVRYTYVSGVLQNPQILLDNINAANIHNGCRLLIMGGKLFITAGDAGTQSVAQNVSLVNGKILRINLDGTIPSDNPIAGSPVWSWGHRNAQGLVNVNGKLFSSEHGDVSDDEINIIEKGRNYGWPTVKGFCNLSAETAFCNDSNVKEPVKAWTPTLAVCGVDYYDHAMFPAFQRSLIMTTLKDQTLYSLALTSGQDSITSSAEILDSFGRLRDVCISPEGRIYISTSRSNAAGTGPKIDRIIELYDPSFQPVGTTNITDDGIDVFPNPAGDELRIRLRARSAAGHSFRVINIYGQTVAGGSIDRQLTTVDVRHLPVGLYHVQISGNNKLIVTEKILKQ